MEMEDRNKSYLCRSEKEVTMVPEKYVRFDWAAKRLLRDKANFCVLEGLVSVLLEEKIQIVEILDSESNQEHYEDKFNRVDIKAKNSKGEIIIVEVQQTRKSDFLGRILYGVSKSITEHIFNGEDYQHVKKVYSISILYFSLGKGADYLYHGQTTFTGVHTHDTLEITEKEGDALKMKTPKEVFPEYYIIRVNEFDKVAATPLEEWLDYLKNGRIKDDTTAPGLNEAREKLQYLMMSNEERSQYDHHLENWKAERNAMETARLDGLWEGRREGRREGRHEGRLEGRMEEKKEIVAKMRSKGFDIDTIMEVTGLTRTEIEGLDE